MSSYIFPILSNDDDSSLYFQSPITLSNDDERTGGIKAFYYGKETGRFEVAGGSNLMSLREKLRGYYKHITDSSDGTLRIDTKKNAATFLASGDSYEIINPKDVDGGASEVFLAVMNQTESNIPFRQSDQDLELVVYDRNSQTILRDLTLPFSGLYIPIGTWENAMQSVVSQRYIYIVLNSSIEDFPTIETPKKDNRWHVLIYDAQEDVLYSVWHGVDVLDRKKVLSFSYYLGREGLYFEVLKEGKIEVYLVDIDLKNAKPLKEYETVDLLWNNKGLKAQWEKKIQEAKAKDPSFEERWE